MRLRMHCFLFILGIFYGILLLSWQAFSINEIDHDDAVSYLAATGHQGLYETDIPVGQWVPAIKWKAYWTPSEFWNFKQIGYDLAFHDIHPPLYFWLLHIWLFIIGMDISSAALLNIIFLVLSVVFIYYSCIELRSDSRTAITASLLWFLSGSTLSVEVLVRQYCLLGLTVAFFLYSVLRFLNKESIKTNICLFVSIVFGLLTHYYFILVFFALIFIFIIILIKEKKFSQLKQMIISSVSAILFSLIIHPHFYNSFIIQQNQRTAISLATLIFRLKNVINVLCEFFIPIYFVQNFVIIIVILLSIIASIMMFFWLKKKRAILSQQFISLNWLPIASALTISLMVFGLYIFNFAPVYAMTARYIMILSPIYFVLLSQILNLIYVTKRKPALILFICLCVSQTIYGSSTVYQYVSKAKKQYKTERILKEDEIPIIIDTLARGVIPAIIWHINDKTQIYAAYQKDILKEFPDISSRNNTYLIYISHLRYGKKTGNNKENRKTIINEIIKLEYKLIYNGYTFTGGNINIFEKIKK